MSLLSPRLQLRVAQKQILTPGLVQMVTVLQLNRLELKEMIAQEIAMNPVLEEHADGGEELTPEEVQVMLEAERVADPYDKVLMEALADTGTALAEADFDSAVEYAETAVNGNYEVEAAAAPAPAATEPEAPETKTESDPFDEIDFGSFFDDYLDPGYKTPSSESVDKPSFETFLSAPVTLTDHLHDQLAIEVMAERVRDAAETIIGNLNDDGYLPMSLEEIAESGQHRLDDVQAALKMVQAL